MKTKQCDVGNLEKTDEGFLLFTVTCAGQEITGEQMLEVVHLIDVTVESSTPLLIDARQRHSASYGALIKMSKGKQISAVAIYAPEGRSYHSANYIEKFQTMAGHSPYPFKTFTDLEKAKYWLSSFLMAS